MSLTIHVGSVNEAKLLAVRQSAALMFPEMAINVCGEKAASLVSAQPMSDPETIQGAMNRAREVKTLYPDSDFWVGIEGGVEKLQDTYFESGWVVVLKKNNPQVGYGSSGRYEVSHKMVEMIKTGKELGDVIDEIMGMNDLKSTSGAMGLVTNGLVDRHVAYIHGILFAFGKFVSDEKLWK
jgi:inosine/xanthosine triphosphatase